jgi:hypothetical protein
MSELLVTLTDLYDHERTVTVQIAEPYNEQDVADAIRKQHGNDWAFASWTTVAGSKAELGDG